MDDEELGYIPSEGSDKIPQFVENIYNDSVNWRNQSLNGRFKPRFATTSNVGNFDDPVKLWETCRKLANGNHWSVWGHRTDGKNQDWKHEIEWSAIEDQIRLRTLYLTSNMHEVDVKPNLKYANEAIKDNFQRTQWHDFTNEYIKRCCTDGTAFAIEILDTNLDPDGVTKTITLDPASCLPTPHVTSHDRTEGCWYFIITSAITKQQAIEKYGDAVDKNGKPLLDVDKLNYITEDKYRESQSEGYYDKFKETKFVSETIVFLDDPKIETIPFSQEEFFRRVQMISEMDEKGNFAVKEDDIPVIPSEAHRQYLNGYLDWFQSYASSIQNPTPEDEELFKKLLYRVQCVLNKHDAYLKENANSDKQYKYPFGRKITMVDRQIVEDQPNPYLKDWRRVIYKTDMEKVPGCYWGRGIPEILWSSNQAIDTFYSRIADSTVYMIPQKWLNVNDKQQLVNQKAEYTNDPNEIQYYATTPPTVVSGSFPQGLPLLTQEMKQSLERSFGMNETTVGGVPFKGASGDLVQTLLAQNQISVTGEVNQNWLATVTNIVETKLAMMKTFYKQPRQIIINGQPQELNLSEELAMFNGQPLDEFQVTVRPNSNFPNQWENNLAFAIQFAQALAAVPLDSPARPLIIQIAGERFPDILPGGKFYKETEATRLGLEVMAQHQQAMEQEQKRGQAITAETDKTIKSTIIRSLQNGKTQAATG